jgi:hypothetical protein
MKIRSHIPLSFFLIVFLVSKMGIAATPSQTSTESQAASTSTTRVADAIEPPDGGSSTGDTLPDAPQAQSSSVQPTPKPAPGDTQSGPQQTKRILFIIPNFRSVSADVKLPPTTSTEKFKIFLDDSFDYSAFVEVALLAGLGEAEKSEPPFHSGAPGYARYYWHSFADNTDGNLMTEYLVPLATREDPRYYTLGHGGVFRRSSYSVSRLFITRNNQGNPTANFSEIVGNGAAAGVSNLYYPSIDRSWTKTGQRWVLQVGIDGIANLVKEFWPDINSKIFHDKY